FYRVVALAVLAVMTAVARASGARCAATTMAAVYTLILVGFEWILPLFHAEPKLGPVFTPVTHFIPNGFPLLLLPPAVALDLLWARAARRAWSRGRLAIASGALFLIVLMLVQWPFANFLLTPAARNWVFGMHYVGYNERPDFHFYVWERTHGAFLFGMTLTLAAAIAMSGLGLLGGDWMR